MKTDRELGAARIMESLSAVSEELLERCETAGRAAAPKEGKKYRYVYRYALACAACLCLIAVGTAYYALNLRKGGAADGSPQLSGGAGGAGLMNGMSAPEDAPMDGQEAMETAPAEGEGMPAGEAVADVDQMEEIYSMMLAKEPEWLDVGSLAALPGEAETEDRQKEEDSPVNLESIRTETVTQIETDAGTEADAWAKAARQAAVTRVEAARVPEGYSLMQADSDGAAAEPGNAEAMGSSLVRGWSNGEYSLWVRITQTGLTPDMRFEAAPPVYSVQEAWKESIPDAGADGYTRFALLYEDGMLAEYCGCLDSGEIVTLMESLAAQDPAR